MPTCRTSPPTASSSPSGCWNRRMSRPPRGSTSIRCTAVPSSAFPTHDRPRRWARRWYGSRAGWAGRRRRDPRRRHPQCHGNSAIAEAPAALTRMTQMTLAMSDRPGRRRLAPDRSARFVGGGNVMAAVIATEAPARAAKPWYKVLYVQVLVAILLGILVGSLWPHLATNDWIKALGDGFIKLIKMVIAPIIFCTVVSGISHIQDARKVGRVGVKALIYFEVVSSFALMLGLIVGNLVHVGQGLGAKPDAAAVATYVKQAEAQKSVDFVLNIIPDSVVGALARGDILQVLLFAILFGFALMALGERGHRLRDIIDDTSHAVFGVIAIVMKAAPFGAFGAMAYTIGKFGPAALGNLVGLIVLFYATAALFVIVVLGTIARVVGFSIFKFIAYIKDELLIVLGTSSSESALPQLMEKLERLGCS